MTKRDIAVCIDVYPDADTDVFRIGAADGILRLLADAHDTEFTIPELVDATPEERDSLLEEDSRLRWSESLVTSLQLVREQGSHVLVRRPAPRTAYP